VSARPTILLTGAGGQLGRELLPALAGQGEVVAFDRAALDLARPDAIVGAMRLVRPAIVVNAGAYTNVDQAERESALADAVNGVAPGVIAEEAKRSGALVVHFSTDYVFDGEARSPCDEDHPVAPRSAYGRSKLAGERAIAQSGASALVFRTSWVYGLAGRNFLVTMRRLAGERSVLRVVDDQTGTPNWTRDLARATAAVLAHDRPWLDERAGLYHLSSRGDTTWCGFARAILADRPDVAVEAITTADYPTPAARPRYSVLGTAKFERTFGFALPAWRDALAACLAAPPAVE
jgi:dTDP-4-dehydrorhamnose reductase